MRVRFALLLSLVLPACTPQDRLAAAALNVGSVPVFGRSIPDVAVSLVSGKDCSVVRLEQGKSYCREAEPPPPRPPFCTRSLGTVDCWSNPEMLSGGPPREVADGPRALTPAQEAYRTRHWPNF
ncbi:hypothetical protein [Limobrevibacterium gyesilva]|nr:hypothetical protein [Limobrevibacterium gyesilva]